MAAGNTQLGGWGRHPVLDCRVEHLREPEDVQRLLERNGTLIPRGAGRAYGDAALNRNLTLSTLAMDRMQAFDPETGLLTCESGVMLADILDAFVPRGWFPPVVPGTKFVTVGGMIAADVHGKNHHRDGSFGTHVVSLSLALADGRTLLCSRSQHAELFRATVGGMGLTGIILSASFRLQRIETAFVSAEAVAASNLDETMALFEESEQAPYSVAWIDCLARGAQRGRSLLMRGDFMARAGLPRRLARDPLRRAPGTRLTVPFDAPSALLSRTSIGLYNALHYHRERALGAARPVHFNDFFFPLDGIGAWNRLYGRRGFVQYQCVLPHAESSPGLAALLQRVARAQEPCFLATLKLLGAPGDGMMSFPLQGYTLTLDVPMRAGTLALLRELDATTLAHGGRVYLAKDACQSKDHMRQGYPSSEAFSELRAALGGPGPKFASALSERLEL